MPVIELLDVCIHDLEEVLHNSGSSSKFITRECLAEFWEPINLQEFFTSIKNGIEDKWINYIRGHLLQVFTTLVYGRFTDWTAFYDHYFDPNNISIKLEDKDLPIERTENISNKLPFLTERNARNLFYEHQHIFTPIVIREPSESYAAERRLPLIRMPEIKGRGAYGDVFIVKIPPGGLQLGKNRPEKTVSAAHIFVFNTILICSGH